MPGSDQRVVMFCDPSVFSELRQSFPERQYPSGSRMDLRTRYNYMPVIHSPYVMMATAGDPEPSILHEFDEWFAWAIRKHSG